MAIIIRLDRVLADKKIQLSELADKVDISIVNLSNLKTGKVKAIRFSTLNSICRSLNCQPGDILEYYFDGDEDKGAAQAESRVAYFEKTAILETKTEDKRNEQLY